MLTVQPPITITHVIVGLDVGGAERFLCRLIEAHRNRPQYVHRVISLTTPGVLSNRLQEIGVPVMALGMQSVKDVPRTYRRLYAALKKDVPDVLQCWMYYADLLGGIAGRRLRIPTVLWGIRNSHFESGGTPLKRAIRKLCAISSRYLPTRIVCVAHSALAVHVNAGYDERRMLVVHNGYDVERFRYSDEGRRQLRQAWKVADDEILIGSVGRFSAAKNHVGLIRAAAKILPSHPKLRFVLIGRDVTADNATLRAEITATGAPERFILLGQRSDIAASMSAMDIFCLHSQTEGFPNVLGEAMCVGLACVATDVGDARVLLGNTGVVVPPGDVDDLAAGLDRLVRASHSERRRLGLAARQRIVDRYTLRHAVAKFESLYHGQPEATLMQ